MGHGVIIECNRKMTGCLLTFGGHCIHAILVRFKLWLTLFMTQCQQYLEKVINKQVLYSTRNIRVQSSHTMASKKA